MRVLCWGYLGFVLLAAAVLWGLGDRWWPATLFLFSGRWVVLTPLVLLTPAALVLERRSLAPLAGALAIAVGPVMGLRLGWTASPGSEETGLRLRVVSFNTGGLQTAALDLPYLLGEWQADLVAFQECAEPLRVAVVTLDGWYGHAESGLCALSRYPIIAAQAMDRSDLLAVAESGFGGSGAVVRYAVALGGDTIHVANVHLETPRKGIAWLRSEQSWKMGANTELRSIESRLARKWLDEVRGPLIVAGDFNMPVESRIYREYWSDLRNAFSDAGRGFGMTRHNGWIRVRIDHVLTSLEFGARRAEAGRDLGSDHRPVIVDLALLPFGDD